jgi:hypothetical protein
LYTIEGRGGRGGYAMRALKIFLSKITRLSLPIGLPKIFLGIFRNLFDIMGPMKYYLTQVNKDIFGIWKETDDIEIFELVNGFTESIYKYEDSRVSMRAHKNFIKTHSVAESNSVDALVGLLAMEKL